jgi:heme exporter protein A
MWDDLSAVENLKTWSKLGGMADRSFELVARVGLDAQRADPVSTFSAGMRRRLALARLLLKRPAVALMDEPFGALDPDGRELVIEVVNGLTAGGSTVVLATHLPDVAARCCPQVLRLEAGRAHEAAP